MLKKINKLIYLGKSKNKAIFFSKQVWRYFWYIKVLQAAKTTLRDKAILRKFRNKFMYSSSTTLPRSFCSFYIFSARYPTKYVNYFTKLKVGRKLGEFFFTRKTYYYPQKDRKKKR